MLAIQASAGSMQEDMRTLSAKMDSIKLSVLDVKDEVASLRARFQELVAELRKFTDEEHTKRPLHMLLMDERAQKFWGDYFSGEECVSWDMFKKALCKEYTLTSEQTDLLKGDLDINKDGSVHIREFNIFSKKLGLPAAIQAGCQIAPQIASGGALGPSLKPMLELCILMDTTGSMGKWLEQAKSRCLELEASLTGKLQARAKRMGLAPFQVAALPAVSTASCRSAATAAHPWLRRSPSSATRTLTSQGTSSPARLGAWLTSGACWPLWRQAGGATLQRTSGAGCSWRTAWPGARRSR